MTLHPSFRPPATLRMTLALLTLVAGLGAAAWPAPLHADGRLALEGRDAVSYFTAEGPKPGLAGHALHWRGLVWFFASAQSLNQFEANPAAYAPRYGGNGVKSVISGKPRAGDPDHYLVLDGRLYLFGSAAERAAMLDDPAGFRMQADVAWKLLRAR